MNHNKNVIQTNMATALVLLITSYYFGTPRLLCGDQCLLNPFSIDI